MIYLIIAVAALYVLIGLGIVDYAEGYNNDVIFRERIDLLIFCLFWPAVMIYIGVFSMCSFIFGHRIRPH